MQPVSVLDLTVSEVEQIERAVGVPVNRWGTDVGSLADLYVRILAAATKEPEEKYRGMTMRQLVASVSLDEDTEDPTPASEP